jgi:hypothetical protein
MNSSQFNHLNPTSGGKSMFSSSGSASLFSGSSSATQSTAERRLQQLLDQLKVDELKANQDLQAELKRKLGAYSDGIKGELDIAVDSVLRDFENHLTFQYGRNLSTIIPIIIESITKKLLDGQYLSENICAQAFLATFTKANGFKRTEGFELVRRKYAEPSTEDDGYTWEKKHFYDYAEQKKQSDLANQMGKNMYAHVTNLSKYSNQSIARWENVRQIQESIQKLEAKTNPPVSVNTKSVMPYFGV